MSKIKYISKRKIVYFSPRYSKYCTVPIGYPSDGASGPAADIPSKSWWVHDRLVPIDDGEIIPPAAVGFWEYDGYWDDGTACGPVESTLVMHDILWSEGYYVRAITWFIAVLPFQMWKQRNRDMSAITANPML